MDKIKHPGKNLSIRKSFILYVLTFILLDLFLSAATISVCDAAAGSIRATYPPSGEKYYLTNEQGEQFGEGVYIGTTLVPLSKQDERAVALLEMLPVIATIVYSVLCILAAALLFYKNKLKRPLADLQAASEKIANNDLDFELSYDSDDELGQLCVSFETMRAALAENFSEMWQQVEERKVLNAAFAHDLRTPLTVLKGYNEMLQMSEQIKTRKIAATMGKHIFRMENYINSMSNLRRLEDAWPEYRVIPLQQFLSSLHESAKIVCKQNGKMLHFQNETSLSQVSVDSAFISQVCNNLLSNAVRYARTTVTLSVSQQDHGFLLSVADDGRGFEQDTLRQAANPYFTEESDHSEHFGLGLYICKLLCAHHGGFLKIDNCSNGAKISAFFSISSSL